MGIDIKYEKGKIEDLDTIYQVFKEATEEMDRNNIPQWDEVYPNVDVLREDMELEQLFVGRIEEDIAVVFVINDDYDDQYENGQWQHKTASFRILHRLCVSPRHQRKGVGALTLKYIEEILKKDNIESIRLDAFSKNPYALKMYENEGYKIVGEVHWRKGMFYLMEKGFK